MWVKTQTFQAVQEYTRYQHTSEIERLQNISQVTVEDGTRDDVIENTTEQITAVTLLHTKHSTQHYTAIFNTHYTDIQPDS